MVASAIRRARHASRSPACTRDHTRGSRYFSSTDSAITRRPASVERPIASANSAMQNSETSGAPSPARGRPVSPAAVIQVASSPIDSGGCCSAQVTAAVNSTASAWMAAARAARATRSTSLGESSSPRLVPMVDVIDEFKHRPLTVSDEIPLLWKGILDHFSPIGSSGFETLASLAPQPPRKRTDPGLV